MAGHPPPRSSRRAHSLALAAAAFGVLVVQFAVAAPSAFAFSCSVDDTGQTADITLDASDTGLKSFVRSGDVLVFDGHGCGMVTMLQRVNLDMNGQAVSLGFDVRGGPFGDATHDVTFVVTHAKPDATSIGVFGTDGSDAFTVGSRLVGSHRAEVLNLNANSEPTGGPTDDVVFKGVPSEWFLFGGKGNDQIIGSGTHTPGSGPTRVPMMVEDDLGADTVVGGDANDVWVATQAFDAGNSFSGGKGFDFADLSSRFNGVSISLDGVANDGSPGENDNIGPDVEFIRTGSGDDTLTGTAGHQVFDPGDGANTLFGGPGPDLFELFGFGPDVAHGGPGFDTVTYEDRQAAVDVTLDGLPDDGAPSEGDNVEPDIERVIGSNLADTLTGNAGPNTLLGAGGNDVLRGMGGNDVLNGGGSAFFANPKDGSDQLHGGPGVDTVFENTHSAGTTLSIDGVANDVVNGHPGEGIDDIGLDVENVVGGDFADRITGSAVANVLTGGKGNDVLVGLAGDDHLRGGPGDDSMNGGPGSDVCLQGPGTGPKTGCEH